MKKSASVDSLQTNPGTTETTPKMEMDEPSLETKMTNNHDPFQENGESSEDFDD
jgi:hypothetical protein